MFNHIYVISEIDDETLVAFLNEDQANKDGNVHKGREESIITHLPKAAIFLQIDVHTYITTLFPNIENDAILILAVLFSLCCR